MFEKFKICKKASVNKEGKTYFCLCAEDSLGNDILICFLDFKTLFSISNRLGIFLNKEVELDKPYYLN